ncbi:MAG: hypothetical protein HOE76_02085 [Euryarchaeota archaeon]|jgi:hypothetical protein|nr:hypothetical protein [Euryarchaeota archaeon]MBT4981852.1 hypothetical protein [Euryarchaeota archaeon]MBT5185005.1 hypothetical protein [Euryarchaeota archaeon]
MSFMDDIKTDTNLQKLVAGMVFFALVFPLYFGYASGQADTDFSMSGPVGDYTVNGTISFHEIGSGGELIEHEKTAIVGANSDAGGVEDLNIIGFRITTSHTDTETPCAPTATPQDDEISVLGGINDNTTSYTGTESNWEGSYFFVSDFLNVTFEEVSSTDLDELLDGGDAGFGEYTFELGVTVNRGQAPFGACTNNDNNEQVDWKIELISLEYTLETVEAEEEEEESED